MNLKIRDFFRNPKKIRKTIENGHRIIITNRNEPFALVIPLTEKAIKARAILSNAGKILKEAGISEVDALKIIKGI